MYNKSNNNSKHSKDAAWTRRRVERWAIAYFAIYVYAIKYLYVYNIVYMNVYNPYLRNWAKLQIDMICKLLKFG